MRALAFSSIGTCVLQSEGVTRDHSVMQSGSEGLVIFPRHSVPVEFLKTLAREATQKSRQDEQSMDSGRQFK